jgi:amidase
MFDEYDLNIIIGPIESDLDTFASCSGYPIAALPVGYLDFNGRAHGIAAVARANDDGLLVQFMSAFEKTWPGRIPPKI